MPEHNRVLHVLEKATIALYPAEESGAPRLGEPVWIGGCAEGLRITERWLKSERQPTGRAHPRHRPLVAQYAIAIERLWVLPQPGLGDVAFERGDYVLDVVWEDPDTDTWHREAYFGVTIDERSRESRESAEFREDQQFLADYYYAEGGSGTPAALAATLPYTVRWVGKDGVLTLYRYDPATRLFTEASPGLTTGRAVVGYVPDQSGYFQVLFSGDTPAFQVTAGPVVVHVGDARVGVPGTSDLPRCEFWIGGARVLSVGRTNKSAWAQTWFQDDAASGADRFEFMAANALAAIVKSNGTVQTVTGGTIQEDL